jgi:hypothetical protein
MVDDKRKQIPTLHNMALIAYIKDEIKTCLKYESEANAISQELNDTEGIYYTCKFLGKIMCEAGEVEKGLRLLCQAYDVGIKAGFPKIDKLKAIIEKYSKK